MMVPELRSHVKSSSQMDKKGSFSTQGSSDAINKDLLMLIKRDTKEINYSNYLTLLLQVYKDQIKTFNGEIKHKNYIISDLLDVIKHRTTRGHSERMSPYESRFMTPFPLVTLCHRLP